MNYIINHYYFDKINDYHFNYHYYYDKIRDYRLLT